ncbi:hypothetical protein LCGC14_2269690 [marine sediment metagenome]|uniref:GIY-YIG domain-containing protein n=1 Tax=marine sediment metagenome TaxID=412755 RepID=A0A0F9DJJ6_9ZZZZ
MAAQTFTIELDGFWREQNKGSIPAKSGVYCVYSCVSNTKEKIILLKKLIYIGESEDVNNRISDHEKLPEWRKHLKSGEMLCYSFGEVEATNRARCEAAMIFKHKLQKNTEYVGSFAFDQTTMNLSGATSLLSTSFTVNRTNSLGLPFPLRSKGIRRFAALTSWMGHIFFPIGYPPDWRKKLRVSSEADDE